MELFQPIDRENMQELAPYFAVQTRHISDFSLAFQYMWYDALKPAYAFIGDCLVLREYFAGKCYYHFPLSRSGDGEAEMRAVAAIEERARDTGERIHYTNVPKERLPLLTARYAEMLVTNNRRWRDYLYRAEDFKEYPGKKYAGQRNHVRKFEKLYPDWQFREALPTDMGAIEAFLHEYEASQRAKGSPLADEELDEVYAVLPHMQELHMRAGILTAGGRIVGFSAGERCGDMVVVHIEKALRECEGVYPFLARQFARAFCGDGVRFLNRMDDAGDLGLRKSKLQYGPCELVDKYNVTPKRAIDFVMRLPDFRTERLVLKPVEDADKAAYARLAGDVVRNRYWGYDWRSDRKRRPADSYFLKSAREDFAKRREMPLGIYLSDMLVGEAVLHRFGYDARAEIGVRLLPEYEGMGYAREAVCGYAAYAFSRLNLERLEAKCYKENARSRAMLLAAGMRPCGEDETYFYFYRTPEG